MTTLKVFEFFIPVYLEITDKSDIEDEFFDWKEYLIKRL